MTKLFLAVKTPKHPLCKQMEGSFAIAAAAVDYVASTQATVQSANAQTAPNTLALPHGGVPSPLSAGDTNTDTDRATTGDEEPQTQPTAESPFNNMAVLASLRNARRQHARFVERQRQTLVRRALRQMVQTSVDPSTDPDEEQIVLLEAMLCRAQELINTLANMLVGACENYQRNHPELQENGTRRQREPADQD